MIHTDKATILYRMAQECINNIVKHSQAKIVQVSLVYVDNLLALVLEDDGIGYNVGEKILSAGAGLKNLQNRAKLIKAQLSIISSPGNGSRVKIELEV